VSLYTFGPFSLDTERRRLSRGGEAVRVTPKAFDTLLTLVAHAERVIEKDELMAAVWPGIYVEEDTLAQNISTLRRALGDATESPEYIATLPRRGYRFVAPVVLSQETAGRTASAPITGAMPLASPHYVRRPADDAVEDALLRGDSVVLIKGARQIGKTSLLARGLQRTRTAGAAVVLTDFQDLGASDLESSSTLLLSLARAIARDLDCGLDPLAFWSDADSANTNFGRFMRNGVLSSTERAVVWGLDEVDRLFSRTYGPEVFGLFRSWHNRRALDPDGPWHRLTLAIAYATEAHLFITDVNQSPFNIGTRFALEDFTLEQVAHLNRLHASPLHDRDITTIHQLLNGHPFLTQGALQCVASGMDVTEFVRMAASDDGPFAEHLHRLVVLLGSDPVLAAAVRQVLSGKPIDAAATFYRLRSAGVLGGESAASARLRCPLYAAHLQQHLR
jgi:DNA-binding winged helix-turn-helix (wHTH) protein